MSSTIFCMGAGDGCIGRIPCSISSSLTSVLVCMSQELVDEMETMDVTLSLGRLADGRLSSIHLSISSSSDVGLSLGLSLRAQLIRVLTNPIFGASGGVVSRNVWLVTTSAGLLVMLFCPTNHGLSTVHLLRKAALLLTRMLGRQGGGPKNMSAAPLAI